MKYFFTALFICFYISSQAQDTVALKQTFKFSPFIVKNPEKNIERAGLTIKSLVNFGFPYDHFRASDYYFELALYDSNNKLIYFSDKGQAIKAREEFATKGKAKPEELSFFIFWEKIQLPPGKHNIKVSIKVSYEDYVVGTFYNKFLAINIPKLILPTEQKVEYSKVFVKDNTTYKGIRGVALYIDLWVKYATWRTRGIAYDNDLLQINHSTNMYSAEDMPLLPAESSVYDFLYKAATETETDSAIVKYVQFLPYHLIQSSMGNQSATIITESYIKGFFEDKLNHYNIPITWFQPQKQVVRLDVDSISIAFGKYDYSSAIVRIFSRTGTNAGRGYPDTYWMAGHGEMSEYDSDRYKNSFSAPPGNIHFVTVDHNQLFIKLYDYDAIGADDLLGEFAMDNSPGNKNILKRYKSEHTENIIIHFRKEKLYIPDSTAFYFYLAKMDGVSGYMFEIKPITDIPENQKISTSIHAGPENLPLYMYNSEYPNWQNSETTAVDLNETKTTRKYFIPAIELDGSNKIQLKHIFTFLTAGVNHSYQLDAQTEIRDFELQIKNIAAGDEDGVYGYRITTSARYNDYYQNYRSQLVWKASIGQQDTSIGFTHTLYPGEWSIFLPFTQINKYKSLAPTPCKLAIQTTKGTSLGSTTFSIPVVEGVFYELKNIELTLERPLNEGTCICVGNTNQFVCSQGKSTSIHFDNVSINLYEKDKLNVWVEYGRTNSNSDDLVQTNIKQSKWKKLSKGYTLKKNKYTGKIKVKADLFKY